MHETSSTQTIRGAGTREPSTTPELNLVWNGYHFTLGQERRTLIMGVLNVTPDSFYDGGRYAVSDLAVKRGLQMAGEGADILDVGGESTRPGSRPVSADEELRRVVPVIGALRRHLPGIPISIDTTKAEVAAKAVDAGASAINDISGLDFDPAMADTAAETGAGLVVMHIQNRPQTMQHDPAYSNVLEEILTYLRSAVERAVEAGVKRDSVVVDPGIGFGKTLEHNLILLSNLARLHVMGRPVLVGASRKSFIGKILDLEAEDRLEGSLGGAVYASSHGAHMVRVHDVKETVRALRIADAIRLGRPVDEKVWGS